MYNPNLNSVDSGEYNNSINANQNSTDTAELRSITGGTDITTIIRKVDDIIAAYGS